VERTRLDVDALAPLLVPAGRWTSIEVLDTAPSTNALLVEAGATGQVGAPAALAAEHQTAGLGRAGRVWETPPRAALTVSALLAPAVAAEVRGWLPLLAGVAVVRVLRDAGVPAALKWPNDVVLPAADDVEGFGPWRKVAGVLVQAVPAAGDLVVVGIGLNVSQEADELPVPTATSLALAGAALDRTALLVSLLTELDAVVRRWEADDGDAHAPGADGQPSLADEYGAMSATLGTPVRVDLAGGAGSVEGTAVYLAIDGALVVAREDGSVRLVEAGDVHHLRRRD
jgi:BirA family biotin operon repressor/biotin-[acetyl-CoA-carboxylase] ligase